MLLRLASRLRGTGELVPLDSFLRSDLAAAECRVVVEPRTRPGTLGDRSKQRS